MFDLTITNFVLLFTLILSSCNTQQVGETVSKVDTISVPSSKKNTFKGVEFEDKHEQILFVTSSNWNSNKGKLQFFIKTDSGWECFIDSIDVALGKNGMAWGRGLHESYTGVVEKQEGDKKTPAGVFEIGTAFGKKDSKFKVPYIKTREYDYYVDDVDSEDYNTWQSLPPKQQVSAKDKWKSFETMKRNDHLYDLGFVVNHNTNPTVKGKGSAIFFHVWRSPFSPTLGCTSMEKEVLRKIITVLDPEKYPLVIQLPKNVINKLVLK